MWCLLATDSRKEHRAHRHLSDQGFETYLPTDSDGPLFPGYLFCRISHENTEIIRQSYIMRLVHFGTQPAIVSDGVVNGLKAFDWHRSEECAEGSEVIITTGPFAHMHAIVKAKKADRIIVLMKLLNTEQELEFPIKAVEAA